MSRIPATTSIDQSTTKSDQQGSGLNEVDVDQFLGLLIAELQNQDPLDPMKNSELVQQISQIRTISATNQLTDTLTSVLLGQNTATASSLIGKRVTALTDDAENVEGVVTRASVTVNDGGDGGRTIRIHIGDKSVRLDNIREIVGEEEVGA
ncbi:MAG: flagellar biosynthesis protein FlgD [Planctomycetota bacterium]|nr:flagellar biosynthesis protein FlgD [Planctomycetota bacterium]